MTAALMREVHGVSVPHQSVSQSVSNYVYKLCLCYCRKIKSFIDNYNYDLLDSIHGDKAYIKVLDKLHYVFFIFYAIKKIILSYPFFANCDVETAIYTLHEALSKFNKLSEALSRL